MRLPRNKLRRFPDRSDGIDLKPGRERQVLAIELEYNAILQPRYKERSEAIKKIPEFWLTVVINLVCSSSGSPCDDRS